MLRIGSIVLGVEDVPRAVEFWKHAVDYVLRESPEDDRWAVLVSPYANGSQIALMKSVTAPRERPRLHLDLYAKNRDAEVDRLLDLGARNVDWDSYPESADFVVLEDPDGNRFCVIEKEESWIGFSS
jgi:predicted enzyme related to lactoylglutathione lyase